MPARRQLLYEVSGGHGFVTASSLWTPRFRIVPTLLLLLFASIVLTGIARDRGAEYDEGYTVFVASGTPRPDWPAVPFRAGDVRAAFDGSSGPLRIAHDLRTTDVHPPLYFWAVAGWRALTGPALFRLRLFSVMLALASLIVIGGIAARAAVPPLPAMLFALGCYGFSYTASVARGFALADLLSLAGVWLLLGAERRGRLIPAIAAGLLLGLASFANYLAVFVGVAALLWLLLRRWREPLLWLGAGLGFAAVMPADLFFFIAQRDSRIGQFPPFHLVPAVARLGQYAAGNVFGGLPLYAEGAGRLALGAALALLLAALASLVAWRWTLLGRPGARGLLAMAALAPPVGLLLLGIAFDTTPIELRYLAYATPFFALLLAGALATLPPARGAAVLVLVLAVQAASLAGLAHMPQTMQPQAEATREAAALAGPDGLTLVPRGDDGVGVVGAVVQSAPDWLRLLVVPRDEPPAAIRARAAGAPVVVLALLGVDPDSRATLPHLRAAFAGRPCWREIAARAETIAYARDRACAVRAER
jgi:4-amino-4-deoxy-L-arabinose transferase-like glycosyltransferase